MSLSIALFLGMEHEQILDELRVNALSTDILQATTQAVLVDSPFMDTVLTTSGRHRTRYLVGVNALLCGDPSTAADLLWENLLGHQQRVILTKWALFQALLCNGRGEDSAALLHQCEEFDRNTLVSLAERLHSIFVPSVKGTIWRLEGKDILAERALQLRGGTAFAQRWLGFWSLSKGRFRAAVSLLQPLAVDGSADHYLWSQLGWARYCLQDYRGAYLATKRALVLSPEDQVYRDQLNRVLEALKAREEANISLLPGPIDRSPMTSRPGSPKETHDR